MHELYYLSIEEDIGLTVRSGLPPNNTSSESGQPCVRKLLMELNSSRL